MATSTLIAEANKEAENGNQNEAEDGAMPLEIVQYIHYLLYFEKDFVNVEVLLDLGCKINAMTLAFLSKLDIKTCPTNIGAQKIDGSTQ